MIDLADEQLRLVRQLLTRHLPACTFWIFGSRAVGRASRYSDLDVAIESSSAIPAAQMDDLREALSLSDLPILVDLVNLGAVDVDFRAHVVATGQRL